MKKFGFIVLISAIAIVLYGCGKKQPTLEEMQQPMSMETLSAMSTTSPAATEAKIEQPKIQEPKIEVGVPVVSKPGQLAPLPPVGPYKPTATEIQRALKNANFYTGNIDGKIGAKTKKAITDFQKANGLTADGKVGPKTWNILSKYLNQEPVAPKSR